MACAIRDERGLNANTATRIGNMFLSLISALEAIPSGMQYKVRDCGVFDPEMEYIHAFDEDEGAYVTDQVWHGGCCWQCTVYRSTAGLYPRYNNSEWACVIGSGNVTLTISSSEGDWFRAGADFTTTLVAEVKNAEMTLTEDEIGKDCVRWSRISDDEEGDTAWNLLHKQGTTGLSLPIDSRTDMPQDWDKAGKVAFRCIVTLPSGLSAEYEYSI